MPSHYGKKKSKSWVDTIKNVMTQAMKSPGSMQAEADSGKSASKKVKDLGFLPDKKSGKKRKNYK